MKPPQFVPFLHFSAFQSLLPLRGIRVLAVQQLPYM